MGKLQFNYFMSINNLDNTNTDKFQIGCGKSVANSFNTAFS